MPSEQNGPFRGQVPVRDSTPFVGRSIQLMRGCDAIIRKGCLSLVGERGCGLSSLLNRLMADDIRLQCEEATGALQFVHVDCALYDDPLSLIRYLLAEIASDLPVPSGRNWRPAFGRLIAAVDGLQPQRLIILFDDFEHIGSNVAFVEFTDRLRALAQRADMTLITATHTELKGCCHMDIAESPFPNMFQVEYIGSLTREEAREFIARQEQDGSMDLLPYTEQIIQLGGYLPHFLRLACRHYQADIAQYGRPDHEAIAVRFFEEVRPDFDHIWHDLTEGQKVLLYDLVEQKPLGQAGAELIRKGYVTEEGIFSSAFSQYVQEMRQTT